MAQQKNSSFFTNHLCLLDLAQADYFLFLKLKRELAASPCPPGKGQEEVGGVHQHSDQRRLPQDAQDEAAGLGKKHSNWQYKCQKKLEKHFLIPSTVIVLFAYCTLSMNSPCIPLPNTTEPKNNCAGLSISLPDINEPKKYCAGLPISLPHITQPKNNGVGLSLSLPHIPEPKNNWVGLTLSLPNITEPKNNYARLPISSPHITDP
jgi:hypothetical protein